MGPKLSRVKDLFILCEFDFKDGSTTREFIRTVFVALDKDDRAYWGKKGIRKYGISLEEYEEALEPVPDEEIYPEASSDLTIAPNDWGDDSVYFKHPKIDLYDPAKVEEFLPTAPKLLLDEAKILELLVQHPHPNIVRYHGCRVRRGRITGLVLDRHGQDLEVLERDKTLLASLDKDALMTGLQSAVDHLHGLGLAHNDLNPANVVLDQNNEPILIDFGSCQPFGMEILLAGTPGWYDEKFFTSEKKHDLVALPKIRRWLDGLFEDLKTGA
jgi:serine/threonine protein kinase